MRAALRSPLTLKTITNGTRQCVCSAPEPTLQCTSWKPPKPCLSIPGNSYRRGLWRVVAPGSRSPSPVADYFGLAHSPIVSAIILSDSPHCRSADRNRFCTADTITCHHCQNTRGRAGYSARQIFISGFISYHHKRIVHALTQLNPGMVGGPWY